MWNGIIIYFLAFLPSFRKSPPLLSIYITCISVSMPAPWAVASPNGQLASPPLRPFIPGLPSLRTGCVQAACFKTSLQKI